MTPPRGCTKTDAYGTILRMIIRRRRLWFGLFAVLALAGVVCMYFASANALWTKDTERIRCGMKREQLVATFGKPPDREFVYIRRANWIALDGQIIVQFGSDDRVLHCTSARENVFVWQFRRLRDRLGI